LFANGDFNYAQPRSLDNSDGEQFIPLAPTTTATVGLSIKRRKLSVNLQSRYIADRAANENKSIIAKGYLITDLNATYDFGVVSIGVSVKNLFDQEWNETQFATESRLASEINSTEEIHFTPGAPLFSKGIIKYKF
jgi:outer membrane receptor protein involved in Fe transport